MLLSKEPLNQLYPTSEESSLTSQGSSGQVKIRNISYQTESVGDDLLENDFVTQCVTFHYLLFSMLLFEKCHLPE